MRLNQRIYLFCVKLLQTSNKFVCANLILMDSHVTETQFSKKCPLSGNDHVSQVLRDLWKEPDAIQISAAVMETRMRW